MMAKSKKIPAGRCFLQHTCNALHVYSLLCRLRVKRSLAFTLAKEWERLFHGLIYL